jgi:hypothetical protein
LAPPYMTRAVPIYNQYNLPPLPTAEIFALEGESAQAAHTQPQHSVPALPLGWWHNLGLNDKTYLDWQRDDLERAAEWKDN